MPWNIQEQDGRFCVFKEGDSKPLKCYETEEEARDYLRALYAGEEENKSAVKALGDGRIGGYGVVFTGPQAKDLQGDYFTPKTRLLLEFYKRVPLFYQHGQDPRLGKKVIGAAEVVKRDDVGVWYEAQLNLRSEYERAIYDLVEKGALGYSTGSLPHLVERAQDGRLLSWPVAELTLTPTPAAGPYLTSVEAISSAYKAVGLTDPDFEERKGDDEMDREDKTTMTEEQVKDLVTQEVRAALAPYLKGQPRGGMAHEEEKADKGRAIKAFNVFLHTGKAETKALQEGTDSEGGYLVPDEYLAEIVSALTEGSIIRAAGARVITVNSDTLHVPSLTRSSAATLTAEEAAYNEADPSLDEIVFTPYKFTKLVKVSEELVADATFDLWGTILAPDFAQAFAAAENSYFTTGTGSGQPQGVVSGAETGVSVDAPPFTADDVIDLYHSLDYLYRPNAVWMMHDSVLRVMRKLKDSDGQYLWQPGLQEGHPDYILGVPVITNNFMPSHEQALEGGVIMLIGDFRYYWIAQRAGMSVDRNPYLYMANGQIGFFGRQRVDGRVVLAAAFKTMRYV